MAEDNKEKERKGLALRTHPARGVGRLAMRAGRRADLWSEMDRRLEDVRRDMEDIFWSAPLAATPWFPSTGYMWPELRTLGALDTVTPRVDIRDKGKELCVTADMPGIPKENIEINVTPTSIEISGEAEKNEEEKEGDYTRQERSYQRFYRLLPLPDEVLSDKAEACVNNGVLEVTLPKKTPTPEPKKSKVPVK